jgi:hypothetical protein
MTAKKEEPIELQTETKESSGVPDMDQNLIDECMKVAGRISQLRSFASAPESFTSENQQYPDALQISTKKEADSSSSSCLKKGKSSSSCSSNAWETFGLRECVN